MEDNKKQSSVVSGQSSDENTNQTQAESQSEETTKPIESKVTPSVIASTEGAKQSKSDSSQASLSPDENQTESLLKQIATEPEAPHNDNEKNEASKTKVAVEESADEPTTQDEPAETVQAAKSDTPGKWYVVHTYSGHENKVAVALKQRIESERLEGKIFEVLVPMQDKIEIRAGKKTTVKEKIFPGYILVNMILDDVSWLAVRTTQGVTSFVGIGNKPTPISDAEVATIVRFTKEEAPTFKQVFTIDDTVKIVDGPFAEFIGKVDSVDEEKGKVKVLVSIFGRETPVELDFLQVQKI